jgi:hypothetical protein
MHLLHILIARIILEADLPDCEVILGNDCGGDQYIQLFCEGRAESATRLCSVDAIVLKGGNVIAIIEIEESDIRPMALCGKVLVSILARQFVHRGQSYPIAAHASFVQVVDSRKLSSRSSKSAQCERLIISIRDLLSKSGRNMEYDIFFGDIAEFERPEAQQELQQHLWSNLI